MKHIDDDKLEIYGSGRRVRDSGGAKVPPTDLGMQDMHWWLAGWHDRDIELRQTRDALDEKTADTIRKARASTLSKTASQKTATRHRIDELKEQKRIREENKDVWED